MGCFSFKCKKSGLPAASSSFPSGSDAVYLFLLKDGKVIESMHGIYDSYGQVFDKDGESFEWGIGWDAVCDLIFNSSKEDGIAMVLACNFEGFFPTTQSSDDPEQGWGKQNGEGFVVDEPYHKIH